MRIKIALKTHKLPILYRHRFMALIKEALGESDAGYKQYLYPARDSCKSKQAKPFAFNVVIPSDRTAKKEKITIDSEFEVEDTVFYFSPDSFLSFYVSSSDYQFMINLYNGLLKIKEFDFGSKIILKLGKIFLLNEREIRGDEVIFKTNSPVLIEDRDGKPILPFQISSDVSPQFSALSLRSFNDHFNEIHDRILSDLRGVNGKKGQGLQRKMELIPLNLKKQVVKHTLRDFREKTGKPYMTLTTFQGCFTLKGNSGDLQTLYQVGIGLRTGQGFGMVEVENIM
ncbi:MAG: CRISPR-associated endoribonuclease Cas6 [Candidatus Brocadia sp.]|nr:CRISPR-associated endoribonuclease Cas6 [Candidatus Brocadia sp.]